MSDLPTHMTAVQLLGHGGFEQLRVADDVPVPAPGPNEVLIRVAAAGINNTDINTRTAWYSKSVDTATGSGGAGGFAEASDADASWTGKALKFPRIQGADCCGTICAVGANVNPGRIGERVLVRSLMRSYVAFRPFECWTFGSECDGGFAQYAKAPARESYRVESNLTDAELASFPCAYSTAEGMLHRSSVAAERVVVTGASGGVGSAAVQLAKRRGAEIIAVASRAKHDDLLKIGADQCLDRNADLVAELGSNSVDVVVDLVAGNGWPQLLEILKIGGRYTTAGAIAGPMVELDVRTLYLKDLSFFGCTFQEDVVFENLIGYIERKEIKPLVAKTFPLTDIVKAQQEFLEKKHVGKLVLIP